MKIKLDRELKMCKELKKKGYCYWGVCKYCGAIALLKKLKTGKINHNQKKKKLFEKIATNIWHFTKFCVSKIWARLCKSRTVKCLLYALKERSD